MSKGLLTNNYRRLKGLSRLETALNTRPPKKWPVFLFSDAGGSFIFWESRNKKSGKGVVKNGLSRKDDLSRNLVTPLFIGAPGVSRTRGTRIRNPLLYPSELRGQASESVRAAINMVCWGCQLFSPLSPPTQLGRLIAYFSYRVNFYRGSSISDRPQTVHFPCTTVPMQAPSLHKIR